MPEHKYVIQRRYQTKIAKKVGDALGNMFEHIEGGSLHILEDVAVIKAPKPLSKKTREKLCTGLLGEASKDGDEETLSFECVPYEESLHARAEVKEARDAKMV